MTVATPCCTKDKLQAHFYGKHVPDAVQFFFVKPVFRFFVQFCYHEESISNFKKSTLKPNSISLFFFFFLG